MKKPTISELDIKSCADEKVSTPGFIQSFAFLIAFDNNGRITHVSENLSKLVNKSPEALLKQKLTDIDGLAPLSVLVGSSEPAIRINLCNTDLDCIEVSRETDLHVYELLPSLAEHEDFDKVAKISDRNFRQLKEMTSESEFGLKIARDIREIFDANRCCVFKFDESWNGEVIADVHDEQLESLLGFHFPASDIPPQARKLYELRPFRVIHDIELEESGIYQMDNQSPLDLSTADSRGVSPFHIQYLKNMKVRSSFSLAIFIDKQLWGLVLIHNLDKPIIHYHRKAVLLMQLSEFISVSLSNLKYNQHASMENRYFAHYKENMFVSLLNWTESGKEFAAYLLKDLGCDGISVIYNDRIHSLGLNADETIIDILKSLELETDKIFYTASIDAYPTLANNNSKNIGGFAVINTGIRFQTLNPKMQTTRVYVVFFRLKTSQEVAWAGEDVQKKQYKDSPEDLKPRHSFAKWVQTKENECAIWTEEDKRFVQLLSEQLKRTALYSLVSDQYRQYQMLIKNFEMGFWIFDIENQMLYWNDEMYKIFDVDQNVFKPTKKAWLKLLSKKVRDKLVNIFEDGLRRRKEISIKLINPIASSNEKHTIKLRANYVEDLDGNIEKIVGTARDITQEIDLDDQSEIAFELLSRNSKFSELGHLVASIGHEINNPLQILMLNLEKMERLIKKMDDRTLESKMSKSIDNALHAADRMQKIIATLKNVSRDIVTPDIQQTFDVVGVIGKIVETFRELFKSDNVSIILESEANSFSTKGDPVILEQVVINLLNNARDAMRDSRQKCITITISSIDQTIVINVADTGKGITRDVLPHIFDEFFTTKNRGEGTGLGLYVSKSLIDKMEGTLEVESGVQGTQFTIKLPKSDSLALSEDNEQLPKEASSSPEKSSLSVLVVDDEKDITELLEGQLAVLEHRVTTANSVAEALEILKKTSFDVLISDSKMPGASGEELMKQLNAESAYKSMRKIIMTGDVTKQLENYNYPVKIIDNLLHKPFSIKDLMKVLSKS